MGITVRTGDPRPPRPFFDPSTGRPLPMTGRPPVKSLEKLLPRLCLVLGSLLFLAGRSVAGTANPLPSPAEAEFFEKEIRPVLVRSCGECHGAKQHRGELRLDSRQGMLKGGETGPAVVLGDPGRAC